MSNKVIVVMLGHKSQAGKDTVAGYLSELGFVRAAFADKLKNTVQDLYGFTKEQMYGSTKDVEDNRYPNIYDEKYIATDIPGVEGSGDERVLNPEYKEFFTPRRILQVFGQQQRALYPTIWPVYVFNVAIPKLIEQGHSKIVITDFRFKNEAAVAEQWAADSPETRALHTVKIYRPDVESKTSPTDISEIDLDDYTFQHMLTNDGSLEDLREKSLELVRRLLANE